VGIGTLASRKAIIAVACGAAAVIVAVLVINAGLSKHVVAKNQVPNPYVNRGFGFSISYPQGWSAQEFRHLDANTTTLVSFNDSAASIDIVASKMRPGDTLDSLDAKSKQLALASDRLHEKSIESEGSGTLANQDVKVRTWTISVQGSTYKQVVYHLVHRGYLLSISFISPQAQYSNELDAFTSSLKSLTLF
jgi:hypothetical protein